MIIETYNFNTTLAEAFSFLDSAANMTKDLQKLNFQYNESEKQVNDQASAIAKMMEDYNSILETLNETYAKMDKIVTQAEIASQPKKRRD